jgi:8-oxo-dGTP diphosphatase
VPDELHIVVAIVRRGDEVLMVRQAGPGEEPVWTIPGGRVEAGEFVTDALVREVREESGIAVLDIGALAFIVQVDERRDGWFATVWTWDVRKWEGTIAVEDPDGFVLEAAWVGVDDALERLEQISWHALTARYIRRELEPRSVWLRRVHADGREELDEI